MFLERSLVAEELMLHIVLVHAFVAAAVAELALVEGHREGRVPVRNRQAFLFSVI